MRERRAIASAQMAVADCDTAIANTKRITALYDDLLRASKLLLEALDLPPRARNRERAIRTCARNVRKRVPGAVTEARCKGPAAALYEAGGADVASRAEEAEASAADGSADVQ